MVMTGGHRSSGSNACVVCGYSFAALPDGASCPECGSPRDRWERLLHLKATDANWLRRLVWGVDMFAASQGMLTLNCTWFILWPEHIWPIALSTCEAIGLLMLLCAALLARPHAVAPRSDACRMLAMIVGATVVVVDVVSVNTPVSWASRASGAMSMYVPIASVIVLGLTAITIRSRVSMFATKRTAVLLRWLTRLVVFVCACSTLYWVILLGAVRLAPAGPQWLLNAIMLLPYASVLAPSAAALFLGITVLMRIHSDTRAPSGVVED